MPTRKSPRKASAKQPVVLLTGFEPFGGEAINPSAEIARQLNGAVIGGHQIVGTLLPCVFGAAIRELASQLKAVKPALVICVGQAGGRADITPERVAINVDDARIADNAGRQPVDRPIVRGGPAAYWSTLPIKAIVAELRRSEIPASVSQTAGTFVCNHVFYGLMHALRKNPKVRGGFIHVPFLPEQAQAKHRGKGEPVVPSLSLDTMTRAIERAIAVSLKVRVDQRSAGGATH
jgi:pyroglutamyl-peptidase